MKSSKATNRCRQKSREERARSRQKQESWFFVPSLGDRGRGHCRCEQLELGGPRNRHRRRHLRSEEHTSELQSRQYLVCRLLLEKKKPAVNLGYFGDTEFPPPPSPFLRYTCHL